MCTVTIIAVDGGVRLACNRDEQRTRPVATEVANRRFNERTAIMPVDPVSNGTWIAASDAGLIMCLLNVNPSCGNTSRLIPVRRPTATSRGSIIPSLLKAESLVHAVSLGCRLHVDEYAPFRLVIADRHEVAELAAGTGTMFVGRRWRLRTPMLFTSSGMGDDVVQQPRQELFEAMFDSDVSLTLLQDGYHQHRWSDRSHLSINMSRSDACTVSFTTVELDADSVRLKHTPAETNQALVSVEASLDLRRAIAA